MLDRFSQQRADETYRLLAKNGTFITPTLVTEHALTFIDDLNKKADPRMQYEQNRIDFFSVRVM